VFVSGQLHENWKMVSSGTTDSRNDTRKRIVRNVRERRNLQRLRRGVRGSVRVCLVPCFRASDVMKSRRRRFPRRRELVPRKAKSTEVSCYEGMTSSIARSPSDLLTRSFRAIDSIIGQFCLKNVVASWILGACTLTLQACLPPPFVIWKWKV
jgi:hypothetical protein